MSSTNCVSSLSNQDLKVHCWEERIAYQKSAIRTSGFYAHELLRRAVFGSDEAGTIFMDLFLPWLISKVRPLCIKFQHEEEDIIQEALMHFFNNVTPQTWEQFDTFSRLLAYMEKCCYSAAVARWRRIDRTPEPLSLSSNEVTSDELISQVGESIRPIECLLEKRQERLQNWHAVKRNCKDFEDVLLLVTLCRNRLKPNEIVRRYPLHFPEVTDVYKRRRNLIDRVKRDKPRRIIA